MNLALAPVYLQGRQAMYLCSALGVDHRSRVQNVLSVVDCQRVLQARECQ